MSKPQSPISPPPTPAAPPPPAPAPPPAPEPPDPEEKVPATEPKPKSQLPPGVQMHQAGVSPYATRKPAGSEKIARSPKDPPPGWKGTFSRCGKCGDFIGNADKCPVCAPHTMIDPVQMSSLPRMMAR